MTEDKHMASLAEISTNLAQKNQLLTDIDLLEQCLKENKTLDEAIKELRKLLKTFN